MAELTYRDAVIRGIAQEMKRDPDVVFLDEPTTGLDPQARRNLWDVIRAIHADAGKTVVLTTHYLEEADALADQVVVINKGSMIAEGTPQQIKARTAGKTIRCVTRLSLGAIRSVTGVADVQDDRGTMVIHTSRAEDVLREILTRDPDVSGIEVAGAGLEDAFLALTQEKAN